MMHNTYAEASSSQLPALQLLISMRWQYFPLDKALALRGGKVANVLLTAVLEPWLRANNQISSRG